MTWSDLLMRLRALVFHRRAESDLDEELRAHIDLETACGIRAGLPPEEAERVARVNFGGAVQVTESCRDERGITWLEDFARDLVYACRQFPNQKGFFIIAAVTLALGIGATTAVFSAVDGVLLRPLPYQNPERLVNLWSSAPSKGIPQMGFALPDLQVVAARNHSLESVAGYYWGDMNIAGETPRRLVAAMTAANLFPLLGVQPAIGRTFTASEQEFGKHHVVVLSDSLWKSLFGARLGAVGETVRLNGEAYTVIGVMHPSFQFPDTECQLWVPMSFAPRDAMATRGNHFISAIGRLEPAADVEQTSLEVRAIARRLQREFPENAGIEGGASSYFNSVVGDVRPALFIVMAAVSLVLLIACVNVAGLFLARASARQREFSIRTAIGASRPRLARQVLTEAALVGLIGACLGIVLSEWLVHLIRVFGPGEIPRLQEIAIDPRVLIFTVAITVTCILLFGLAPVISLPRIEVADALKGGGRTVTSGANTGRYRDALATAEVSLALVLVIGAGLLLRTLSSLRKVNPGFQASNLLTLSISLPSSAYPEEQPIKNERFFGQLIQRVEALPGVRAAAASTALPIANQGGWGKFFTVERHPASRLAEVPLIQFRQVTPDYLRTLNIPLMQGRFFAADEDSDRPLVAVINESARKRFFPHEDPIGQQIHPGAPEATIREQLPSPTYRMARATIIGVIGDVRQAGLRDEPQPELFVSHLQGAAKNNEDSSSRMYLFIRTDSEPLSLVPAVRAAVRSLDPEVPIAQVATMDERLATSLSSTRFELFLLTVVAGLAIVLAAVGVYGVLSYSVRLKMHELGIRVALGAGSRDVLSMVFGHGIRIGIAGTLLGALLAVALTRLMASVLFEVKPNDAITFSCGACLLLIVSAASSLVPARRAAKADPSTVLRAESGCSPV